MSLPTLVGIVAVLVLSLMFGFSVFTLSFLGAGLFWTLVCYLTGYPNIAPVQRVCVHNGVVRIEHPLGPFRSVGVAARVDLSGFPHLYAEVAPLAKKADDPDFRSAVTPGVRLLGDSTHGAVFGVCLTTSEAQLLVDALNRNLNSEPAV